MNEGSSFGLLFGFRLIFSQKHFTESDPFDDALGDNTHLFAFEGVVDEEHIMLLLLKDIDICQFRRNYVFVIFNDFDEIAATIY